MIDRYWTVLPLSENLRPLLLQNEVELQMATPVHLYWGDTKVHRDGTATLTTHRLLWIGTGKKPVALCLSLANVKSAETQSGFMGFSSPKITVHLHALAPTGAAAAAAAAAGAGAATAALYTRLSFAGDSRDVFFAKLQSALKAAAWTVVPVAAVANASAASIAAAQAGIPAAAAKTDEFKTSTAGIQGIIRKVKHTQAANDKTAEEAFKDLDALMKRAQEMVALAERFARSSSDQQKGAAGAGAPASGDAKAESEAFGALLHGLGIPSPVTRQSAGTAYHVQLSRQLADFICPVLAKAGGGMLALTDVYCGFNRARGTELISPDDLLHACALFPQLGVPAALHVFPASGVKVLRLNAMTDEANSRRIVAILTGTSAGQPGAPSAPGLAPVAGVGSVSDLELSTLMGVSLVLAKQQLLVAEGLALVVRDESADGVRFYPNRFNEWMSDAQLAAHNTTMAQRTIYA